MIDDHNLSQFKTEFTVIIYTGWLLLVQSPYFGLLLPDMIYEYLLWHLDTYEHIGFRKMSWQYSSLPLRRRREGAAAMDRTNRNWLEKSIREGSKGVVEVRVGRHFQFLSKDYVTVAGYTNTNTTTHASFCCLASVGIGRNTTLLDPKHSTNARRRPTATTNKIAEMTLISSPLEWAQVRTRQDHSARTTHPPTDRPTMRTTFQENPDPGKTLQSQLLLMLKQTQFRGERSGGQC